MDKGLNHIIEKIDKFESTHIRIDIGKERRQLIKNCYRNLKLVEDKSLIGVRYNKESITIRIVSQQLISCTESPALLQLIAISDICFIDQCRHGFIIDLSFNLWRWEGLNTSI